MKSLLTLALVCAGFLLGGCADNSLTTDEEHYRDRGPAPYSPDPTRHIPGANPYTRGR